MAYIVRVANIVDPDQTAPKEQSDHGLNYLLKVFFSNYLSEYACQYIMMSFNLKYLFLTLSVFT